MTEVPRELDELARATVDAAFHLHRRIGPGLLESAYELLLTEQLRQRGFHVGRQRPIDIQIDDLRINDAFRADLIVENQLLVELKSIDRLAPVHSKQVLTYLRLMELPLGLLINFTSELFKDGVKRIINNRPLGAFAPWRETLLASPTAE